MAARTVLLEHAGRDYRVEVLEDGHIQIDGQTVRLHRAADGALRTDIGPAQIWTAIDGDICWVFANGSVYEIEVRPMGSDLFFSGTVQFPQTRSQSVRAAKKSRSDPTALTAPMPATVRHIAAKPGDRVRRGDTLIVLEAMKMELPVRAAADGIVRAVCCQEGELVQPGITLIEFEP